MLGTFTDTADNAVRLRDICRLTGSKKFTFIDRFIDK